MLRYGSPRKLTYSLTLKWHPRDNHSASANMIPRQKDVQARRTLYQAAHGLVLTGMLFLKSAYKMSNLSLHPLLVYPLANDLGARGGWAEGVCV